MCFMLATVLTIRKTMANMGKIIINGDDIRLFAGLREGMETPVYTSASGCFTQRRRTSCKRVTPTNNLQWRQGFENAA